MKYKIFKKSLKRGIKIIRGFSLAVKINRIKASIRFQFKDIDNFIHPNYKDNKEIMLGK